MMCIITLLGHRWRRCNCQTGISCHQSRPYPSSWKYHRQCFWHEQSQHRLPYQGNIIYMCEIHTCQPYRIFLENLGKLTSIPVYRGIYKIYRIFKKSNVPPQAAIVHVRSTLNHVLTRYYHEYLPAFYSKSASIWLHVD